MRLATITRSYRWDMGHRLQHHGGLCRNLHGHSYTAEVTVKGPVQETGPSAGMVVDFSALDEMMRKSVGDWDHAMMLQQDDPLVALLETAVTEHLRLACVAWPPTAENIAMEVAVRVDRELRLTHRQPPGSTLHPRVVRVVVQETPRSHAVWETL